MSENKTEESILIEIKIMQSAISGSNIDTLLSNKIVSLLEAWSICLLQISKIDFKEENSLNRLLMARALASACSDMASDRTGNTENLLN